MDDKPQKIYSYEGTTSIRVLDHLSAAQWVRLKVWARVESSNVARILYEEDLQELHVEFSNGSIYTYHQVPDNVAADFFNTDSMGRFVHKRLKGVYGYTKL